MTLHENNSESRFPTRRVHHACLSMSADVQLLFSTISGPVLRHVKQCAHSTLSWVLKAVFSDPSLRFQDAFVLI